ncbi:MAG TPA: sugar phosphate nucleotidyltransferase [Candidatus Pacearchaeota archaeon]|nr:sugar phosphate nucleotidyltransferase [Candidatus Pacearchaeota archaeon]
MKAIILASGNGVRFLPLSKTTPKPLTKLLGKSILEYNIKSLKGIVDEVFIVIGYLGDKIKQAIGENYEGVKVSYIIDNEVIGTGNSAKLAVSQINDDKVIIMNGDDLYDKEDIKNLIEKCPSIAVKKVLNPSSFGIIEIENNKVIGIEEKPQDPKSDLANIGLYCLPKVIFNESIERSKRGEYEITDYIKKLIDKNNFNFIEANFWIPASYPWDLFNMTEALFQKLEYKNLGKIEENVIIKGGVHIGENSVIKSGTYIEGPVYIGSNTKIGPNAYLRPYSVIEDNCSIGTSVEIKNSMINSCTNINHLSYIGDSIIGSNVNLGAGFITANLRHDDETVKSLVKDVLIDTHRKKFGTIIGDNVKTGIGTIIYPGRKIWPDKTTLPQEKVDKDLI